MLFLAPWSDVVTRRTCGLCVLGGLCGLVAIIAANLTESRAAAPDMRRRLRQRYRHTPAHLAAPRPRATIAVDSTAIPATNSAPGRATHTPRRTPFCSTNNRKPSPTEAADSGEPRCSMPGVSRHARAHRRSGAVTAGVGCESCHDPGARLAGDPLSTHLENALGCRESQVRHGRHERSRGPRRKMR